MMTEKVNKVLEYLISRKKLLVVFALANLIGTYYGFFVFYRDQILSETIWLWLFIPDSPLATLLAAISLITFAKGINNSLIDILAVFANLKYGLWTCLMILIYTDGFMQMNSLEMNIFIFFSHLAMSLQAILIWSYTEIRIIPLITSLSYFIVNDVLDYVYQIHPPLPTRQQLFGTSSIIEITLTTTALFLLFMKKEKIREIVKW